jgi:hypothetical protein
MSVTRSPYEDGLVDWYAQDVGQIAQESVETAKECDRDQSDGCRWDGQHRMVRILCSSSLEILPVHGPVGG